MSALTRCLEEEASAISAAANRLNSNQVEIALELLDDCATNSAKLVISGVGKSGIVARKIAATFTSIGLMAIYLNPLDALHGDLGIVAANDVLLLLSNSGETQEILDMIPHLKKRNTKKIALVGKINSTLANCCDVVLDGSVDREVCPLNLAPTASTAVAMAIGDALAAVWMERRGISPADFAINHPAGSLGKQLTLKAIDLMIPVVRLIPLEPKTPLLEIIARLTADSVGACWVAKSKTDNFIIGLITDGDLRRALQKYEPSDWFKLVAEDLMTKDPIKIDGNILAVTAIEHMEKNRRKAVSVLPVVNQTNEFIGLLRLHDLIQAGLAGSVNT